MALDSARSLTADALNALEPQRMNNWTLEVGLGSTEDTDIILGLQSFQLPTETSDLIEIYYMNEKRQYAGRTQYDGGTLTLTDWINQGTALAIKKWREQVYNPVTGSIGLKSEYAKTATLTLYTPGSPGYAGDGKGVLTKKWILKRVWPMSVSWGPLDMQASEKVQIDVQLVYDKAILEAISSAGVPSSVPGETTQPPAP
jgi:hypothetical protein